MQTMSDFDIHVFLILETSVNDLLTIHLHSCVVQSMCKVLCVCEKRLKTLHTVEIYCIQHKHGHHFVKI